MSFLHLDDWKFFKRRYSTSIAQLHRLRIDSHPCLVLFWLRCRAIASGSIQNSCSERLFDNALTDASDCNGSCPEGADCTLCAFPSHFSRGAGARLPSE